MLGYAVKHIGAQKHAPHIEKLYKREFFAVWSCILESNRENLRHKLLENVDIVPLNILQDAVQNVHVGKAIASLILKIEVKIYGTYIYDGVDESMGYLIGGTWMKHLRELS